MSRQDEQIEQEEINNAGGRRDEGSTTQKVWISMNPQLIRNKRQDSSSVNSLLLSCLIVLALPLRACKRG